MELSRARRSLIGVVVLLAAAAGAGCEGADPPDSSPPPTSTTPSSPATPSATAEPEAPPAEPTLPAEAEEETRAGAEAFVEYYWEVVNYATKTGEVRSLEVLGQPSCTGCARGINGISRVYQRDGRIVGGDYKIAGLRAQRAPHGLWSVVTSTHVGAQRAVGAGNLSATFPAGRDRWRFELKLVRGSWAVATLESL